MTEMKLKKTSGKAIGIRLFAQITGTETPENGPIMSALWILMEVN
jgi:hypothetical protein